jgi:hypothetical protein
MFVTIYLLSMLLVIPLAINLYRSWVERGDMARADAPAVAVPLAISAVLFALAYAIIYFIQELFLWWPKAVLGLEAVLYHNNHTWLVSHPQDQLLQGTGALAIFVLGVLIAVASRFWLPKSAAWRLLIVWMIYHAFTQSVFQLSDPVVNPDGDVGDALGYLGFPEALGVPLFLVAIASIAGMGVILSRVFPGALPSLAGAGGKGRQRRDAAIWILGGGFLGAVILIPFKLPPLEQIIGPFILAAFPAIWCIAFWAEQTGEATVRPGMGTRELLIAGGLLVLMLAFFQLVLAPGIRL